MRRSSSSCPEPLATWYVTATTRAPVISFLLFGNSPARNPETNTSHAPPPRSSSLLLVPPRFSSLLLVQYIVSAPDQGKVARGMIDFNASGAINQVRLWRVCLCLCVCVCVSVCVCACVSLVTALVCIYRALTRAHPLPLPHAADTESRPSASWALSLCHT